MQPTDLNRYLTTLLLIAMCHLMLGCSGASEEANPIAAPLPNPSSAQPDQLGISHYLASENFQGAALIFDDGVTVFSGGFGYADYPNRVLNKADTSFRIGSLSKQFTAVAILLLQEWGMLHIDNPVSRYLPDYPNGHRISIKQLLNHTSGIPNYTAFEFYPSIVEQAHTIEDILAYFKDEPLAFEPGSQFEYSNSGYVLLGAIIESVSQVSYSSFLRREIFTPLGMSQSGYRDLEESNIDVASGYLDNYNQSPFIHPSIPNADGGLVSSVSDLLKWHQALQDNTLLSDVSKHIMFTPYLEDAALGWFVADYFGDPVYYHGGGYSGFRAGIYHYPEHDRLIVLLSNTEATNINPLARQIDQLIRE